MLRILPFFSGSCSKAEVFEQLYLTKNSASDVVSRIKKGGV
jgi:hypothetical protein